jgi:hypothetical protein
LWLKVVVSRKGSWASEIEISIISVGEISLIIFLLLRSAFGMLFSYMHKQQQKKYPANVYIKLHGSSSWAMWKYLLEYACVFVGTANGKFQIIPTNTILKKNKYIFSHFADLLIISSYWNLPKNLLLFLCAQQLETKYMRDTNGNNAEEST